MRVKICGITNLEDAYDAINAGADALGFVFYTKSQRYINPFDAKKIVDKLPPFIQTVGLFVNENEHFINQVCANAKMNLAQIIDEVNNTSFENLKVNYIKVLRAEKKEDLTFLEDKHILVDAHVQEFGGAGKRVPLEWFEDIDCSKIILAGGLEASNLKELSGFGFYGVDVSSGVEKHKGKKDKEKMIQFVKEANEII